MMNKGEEIQGRFTAVTADMCAIEYRADIVINTSCEHITQEQYVQWLSHIPNTTTIVVQSNNYFDCSEHINCSNSLEEFVDKSNLTVEYKGVYLTEKYSRYMIIGKNNV
jgi:microcystin degradation protein MlrC